MGRWTVAGVHSGEAFLGRAAAGQRFTVTGIDIFRIVDGQVAELRQEEDALRLWRQFGLLPSSAHGVA